MKFLLLALTLFFCACGYIPTSKMADNVFQDNIYLEVDISVKDPKNSVFVVDAVRDVLINKFDKNPVEKSKAEDFMYVKVGNLDFQPIIYDENGYVVAYRVKLYLEFNIELKNGLNDTIRTSGDYDFDILPNSVISDNVRYEAIRSASEEAFDEFVSIIAMRGLSYDKGKWNS